MFLKYGSYPGGSRKSLCLLYRSPQHPCQCPAGFLVPPVAQQAQYIIEVRTDREIGIAIGFFQGYSPRTRRSRHDAVDGIVSLMTSFGNSWPCRLESFAGGVGVGKGVVGSVACCGFSGDTAGLPEALVLAIALIRVVSRVGKTGRTRRRHGARHFPIDKYLRMCNNMLGRSNEVIFCIEDSFEVLDSGWCSTATGVQRVTPQLQPERLR